MNAELKQVYDQFINLRNELIVMYTTDPILIEDKAEFGRKLINLRKEYDIIRNEMHRIIDNQKNVNTRDV